MSARVIFPPRRILVPVDLSEASAAAWKQAKRLENDFGARVDGLFVQPWFATAIGAGFLMPSPLPVDLEESLETLRRTLGAGFNIEMAGGPVESTILSWGGQGYDLIVMGTHGRTGLQRLIHGSVAETIMRHATIPVLTLRKPIGAFRRILAPIHFEPYALEGLWAAADIAAFLGARLDVLHVVDTPLYGGPGALKGSRHLLAEAIERLPGCVRAICRPRGKLAFGNAAEQIAKEAVGADLVVLVAHRKGFLNDVVFGATTQRLLRHCATPLLALPASTPGAKNLRRRNEKAKIAQKT